MKFASVFPYFRHLAKRQQPLRYLWGDFMSRTGWASHTIFNAHTYQLYFFPSHLTLQHWLYPNERADDDQLIRNNLAQGGIYVDIGANIGTLSIAAAQTVGEKGTLISVEPNPRIYQYLTKNLMLNGITNCQTVQMAVGEAEGETYFSNDPRLDDVNHVVKNASNNVLTVKMTTLDALTAHLPRIDLLKIDVEGYELFVLRGGKNALNKTQILFFESWETPFKANGYSCQDLFKEIKQYGFKIKRRIDGQWVEIPEGHISENVENLLATR